jgi:hypothetical protein
MKKSRKHLILILSFIVVISSLLSGCGVLSGISDKNWDKKGELLVYSAADVPKDELSLFATSSTGRTGLAKALPVSPSKIKDALFVSGSGVEDSQKDLGLIALCSNEISDWNTLFVTGDNERPFVAVVPTEEARALPLLGRKYDDIGYTFGIAFELTSDETGVTINSKNAGKGSSIESALKEAGLSGLLRVEKVNGEDFPIEQVDIRTGYLPNLDFGGVYELVIRKGSTKTNVSVQADTRILIQSSEANSLQELSYSEDFDGFLAVHTDALDVGFWVIEPYSQLVYVQETVNVSPSSE